MFFVSCFSLAFASVHCCLVVTCWKRAHLSVLVGDVNCNFVTFPCGILGQVWYLIVSFPDLCRLSYFVVYPRRPFQVCNDLAEEERWLIYFGFFSVV